MKICKTCGKELNGGGYKFCSDECRPWKRERVYKHRPKVVLRCLKCSKEFVSRDPNRKYCSTACCNQRADRNKKLEKERHCGYCGKSFHTCRDSQRFCSPLCSKRGLGKEREARNFDKAHPIINGIQMKQCQTCKELKPMNPEHYGRNSKKIDGCAQRCKACDTKKFEAYKNTQGYKASKIKSRQKAKLRPEGYRRRQVRKCSYCGVEFRPKMTGRNIGKYCTRECSFKDWHNRNAHMCAEKVGKYYIGHHHKVYFPVCLICGKQFTARFKNSVCCNDRCAMTHHAMNQAKNERGKEYGITKKCRECGKEFKVTYGNKLRDYCSKKCSTKYCKMVAKHTRRARKRRVPYESYNPLDILRRDKWTCCICGVSTPMALRGTYEWNAPEVDHIIPLGKGGHDLVDNVQCLCRECNQEKGDTIPGSILRASSGAPREAGEKPIEVGTVKGKVRAGLCVCGMCGYEKVMPAGDLVLCPKCGQGGFRNAPLRYLRSKREANRWSINTGGYAPSALGAI